MSRRTRMSRTGTSRRTGTTLRSLIALGVAATALSACSLPMDETAAPLPTTMVVSRPSESPIDHVNAPVEMWFVAGSSLRPVDQSLPAPTADAVFDALGAGPPAEEGQDLRTLLVDPLSGDPVLSVTKDSVLNPVEVAASDAFMAQTPTDQVLLLGQVTMSLTSIGHNSVIVTDALGQPLAMPLPDGRVAKGPITAEDYASLVE